MLKQAKAAYDRGMSRPLRQSQISEGGGLGHVMSLETFGDPHLAAALLKNYLRDLPEPAFPESLFPVIRRCPPPGGDDNDISRIAYIRETILTELAPCVYILMSHVLREWATTRGNLVCKGC
jgi:Rho GTPase-activating protein 1